MTSTAATRLDSLRRLARVVECSEPTPERDAVLADIRTRIASASGDQYAPSAWGGRTAEVDADAGLLPAMLFRG